MSLFLPREKTVMIGDERTPYKIRELLASERSIFLFRTNELLGQSIESYVNGMIGNVDYIKAMGDILHGLSGKSTPQELNKFIKDTILSCVISPQSASEDTQTGYEMHFCQYYEHIPALLAAIYDQNFGSTGGMIKKKLQSLGLLTRKPSKTEAEPEQKEAKLINGQSSTNQGTRTGSPLQSTNF